MSLLTGAAATAYNVDKALIERALKIRSPFPIPTSFLASCRFQGNALRPEHNAYLLARWIASLKDSELSDDAILAALTAEAGVPWMPSLPEPAPKRSLFRRFLDRCRNSIRL